jgi:hypothetical protein
MTGIKAGTRAKIASSPSPISATISEKPITTPSQCGTVRRKPKFTPEVISIILFGPGVTPETKQNKIKA